MSEQNKIPTAEEYANKHPFGMNACYGAIITYNHLGLDFMWKAMESYANFKAKYHVEEALRAAADKVLIHYEGDVNKNSILNSYSLDNIR